MTRMGADELNFHPRHPRYLRSVVLRVPWLARPSARWGDTDTIPSMNELAEAQLRKDLILASAFFHAARHDPPRANSSRVLRHALIAAGLWHEQLSDAFHGNEVDFPVVAQWYSSLIELTREHSSRRLLDGFGNLALPAGARFTGCCLTPAGQTAAERILADHPDWRSRLNSDEIL